MGIEHSPISESDDSEYYAELDKSARELRAQVPDAEIFTFAEVRKGRGQVTFMVTPEGINDFCAAFAIEDITNPPEETLRRLCESISFQKMVEWLEKAADAFPEGATLLVDDPEGPLQLNSNDLDFDLLQRFMPPEDLEQSRRLNPQLSTVGFEFRVTDDGNGKSRSLFKTVLEPPELTE